MFGTGSSSSGFGFGANNNNNNQNKTGFGGFGSGTTTTPSTGFGTGSTFGSTPSTTTGTGLFGGGGAASGGSAFGGGGFGQTSSTPAFGSTPFGGTATTSSGSLFGGGTATSGSTGFSGFGANTASTGTGFGSTNTGSSLFGSKPAFGSTTGTTGGSLFGGGTTTSTPAFGSGTTGAFGAANSNDMTSQGTGQTPFQAFTEKDAASGSNTTNHYQSITFMQPYQRFSFEELRLADYAQGRRYGNGSGQTGAFGAGTGFGFGATSNNTSTGFGASSTGGGLFGASSTPATGGFGTGTTSGFGSGTTAGSLFGGGDNKPAGSGLFGSTPAASTTGTGLFGSTNTTTGFGGTTGTTGFNSTNTGTGLFGAQTQDANKGGLFGSTTNNTTGSAFGSGFGAAAQPAATGFGGFGGQTQNTAAAAPAFGGFGGGFGQNNQAKPASAFGSTTGTGLFGNTGAATNTTTGGLFGNTGANTAQTGGLFGNTGAAANTTANTGSSLFGAKPFGQTAAPTTGLFGNTATANTGGGLFGNTAAQQPAQTGGLFGQQNQQKPLGGGLFGQPAQPAGSSLFGGLGQSQPQPQVSSLFGGMGQQQQQQQPASSLFGAPVQQQQQQQALTTSILDVNAFGNQPLSQNLGTPNAQSVGPIATPLSSSQKLKKSTLLPTWRSNPSASSRLITPQKTGYGLSYSRYGSPASLNGTPTGLGGSLLSSNFGRTLNKSFSTNNLRGSFAAEESILSPGAFSPSGHRQSAGGSLKKLVINRNIRNDLFNSGSESPSNALIQQDDSPFSSPRGILRKKVNFENDSGNIFSQANGSPAPAKPSAPVTSANHATPSAEEQGYLRSRKADDTPTKEPRQPEMSQVKGNELAIVHEEASPSTALVRTLPEKPSKTDAPVGAYYMQPSLAELKKLTKEKLKKVSGFTVGREGVGSVTFKVPVDLSSIKLDEIYDKIVVLSTRSCTVYPNNDLKPPVGKGLNVPSRIRLENSWPRARDKRTPLNETSGPRVNKHVQRLNRVKDTKFIDYEKENGVWIFEVEHFTTYAMEYDEDTELESVDGSMLPEAEPEATPTPKTNSRSFTADVSMSEIGSEDGTSEPDDTFDFRKKRIIPGNFDPESEMIDESFLEDRSVGSISDHEEPPEVDAMDQSGSVEIEDQEMAGSFPQPDATTELHDEVGTLLKEDEMVQPKSILKPARQMVSPPRFTFQGDWTEQLQRTVSPKKQDRQALREHQARVVIDADRDDAPAKPVNGTSGTFTTSIDIMNSLFGDHGKSKAKKNVGKGFEAPATKRSKVSDLSDTMTASDRHFHDSFKPHWNTNGILIHSVSQRGAPDGLVTQKARPLAFEGRDICFDGLAFAQPNAKMLARHLAKSAYSLGQDNIPQAELKETGPFSEMYKIVDSDDRRSRFDRLIWRLASILWDPIDVIPSEYKGVARNYLADRLRKEKLSQFWEELVQPASSIQKQAAKTTEEEAIADLACHRVEGACRSLVSGGNFRLATLTAMIGGDKLTRSDMRAQIEEWKRLSVISEFTEPIRALYELIAGNTCEVEGKKGAPEDRAKSFLIPQTFSMTWRQAFGLKLWYGIFESDPLEKAVTEFAKDLSSHKDLAQPSPWYFEMSGPRLWEDANEAERTDLLWGLLRLFSETKGGGANTLKEILQPANISPNPLDFALPWTLQQHLSAKKIASYGDKQAVDKLTQDLAVQLEEVGELALAVKALLHLSSPTQRTATIKALLSRHPQAFDEMSDNFTAITACYVPKEWVWEARALHARSIGRFSEEVEYLLKARDWDVAHKTICASVAPQAIISNDLAMLRRLLASFENVEWVEQWEQGGQVYLDFIRLGQLKSELKGFHAPIPSVEGGRQIGLPKEQGVKDVVRRLLAGLPQMSKDGLAAAAVMEMSRVVASFITSHAQLANESGKILQLPLAQEVYLKNSMDMSLNYYKHLMATGK